MPAYKQPVNHTWMPVWLETCFLLRPYYNRVLQFSKCRPMNDQLLSLAFALSSSAHDGLVSICRSKFRHSAGQSSTLSSSSSLRTPMSEHRGTVAMLYLKGTKWYIHWFVKRSSACTDDIDCLSMGLKTENKGIFSIYCNISSYVVIVLGTCFLRSTVLLP